MEGRVEELEKGFTDVQGSVDTLHTTVNTLKDDFSVVKELILELKEGTNKHSDKPVTETEALPSVQESIPRDNQPVTEVGTPLAKDPHLYRKLEIPIFLSENLDGWLFKVEHYFLVNEVLETEKLEAIAVCLEGDALTWLQWREGRLPISSWTEFKSELLRRFHDPRKGNNYELLMALRQEGMVAEFRTQFELFSAALKEAPDEMLIDAFLNGLREDIRAELRMVHGQDLVEVMDQDLKVEARNRILEKLREEKTHKTQKLSTGPKWFQNRPNISQPLNYVDPLKIVAQSGVEKGLEAKNSRTQRATASNTQNAPHSTASVNSPTPTNRGYHFWWLIEEEAAKKRELGLFYRCDEKYSPLHRLKGKQLNVLILSEKDVGPKNDQGEEWVNEDPAMTTTDLGGAIMALSMHSIVGVMKPKGKTMKLLGKVKGHEVLVLIDCGATHNFIAFTSVERLGISTSKSTPYFVTVGDGYKVKRDGICKGVKVNLQGLQIQHDFYIFDLGGADMVLGYKWLDSLGETPIN